MVKDSLNRVGSTKTVTLCWIKAHIGIPGNERADELAEMGASHTPLGPGPFVPISRTNIHQAVNKNTGDIWNNRWKSRKDARQTVFFFSEIDLNKSYGICKLSKSHIRSVIRAVTGHGHRGRHEAILNKLTEPPCRFCHEGVETPSHIVLECPRFNQHRAQTFQTFTGNIILSWTAEQLAFFLSEPSISGMEA